MQIQDSFQDAASRSSMEGMHDGFGESVGTSQHGADVRLDMGSWDASFHRLSPVATYSNLSAIEGEVLKGRQAGKGLLSNAS
jgi:hypothetical protein